MQCGLLGEKLGHSYSPQIHAKLGCYRYCLYEKSPSELEHFIKSGDYRGLNVTIPYKKAVLPYCDTLSPEASRLGAVNTLVRMSDGSLYGHNTDYFGFQSMAQRLNINYGDKKVLILGSGGASNTVRAVMEEFGANVITISRSGEANYKNLDLHKNCAVIVNATPVGMYPNNGESPVDLSIFPNLEAVMDLIYNPAKTKLLLDAESMGLKTENGLWMLVAQAYESAKYFTGSSLDEALIPQIHRTLKKQMENVILIGMPGCGKSTNGRLLAKALNKQFVDADEKIVELAGCSIPEIFQSHGEEYFRKLETQALAEICKGSGQVIATGGGCVTRPENIPLLHQNGTVIWLRRPVEQLPTAGRPLSQANDLNRMYEVRMPLYQRCAHYTIDCGPSPEETVKRLITLLDEVE